MRQLVGSPGDLDNNYMQLAITALPLDSTDLHKVLVVALLFQPRSTKGANGIAVTQSLHDELSVRARPYAVQFDGLCSLVLGFTYLSEKAVLRVPNCSAAIRIQIFSPLSQHHLFNPIANIS